MAQPGMYKQKNSGKYRYFDGTHWVGPRYDTQAEAFAAKQKIEAKKQREDAEFKSLVAGPDTKSQRNKAIVLVSIIVVVFLVVATGLGILFYKNTPKTGQPVASKAQTSQSADAGAASGPSASASDAATDTPKTYGGIDSQKSADDGSSAIPDDLLQGDFTEQNVGDGGTNDVIKNVSDLVISGQCQNLKQAYPTIKYISCPTDKLPESGYEAGYQGINQSTDTIRINGVYTGHKAGGFVLVLDTKNNLIGYSYIGFMEPGVK